MYYFYHAVPDKMVGDILMPLNQLKLTQPDLYKQYLQSYKGREEILSRRIPLLNCLWNDVLQFLPLHPSKVFQLQKELGLIKEMPSYRYFQIEPKSLEPTRTVVWFKDAPGEQNVQVKWLKAVDLATIQDIPPATISYFKSVVGSGEGPFNYQFVPHIVYKGSLDVSDFKIISLT